MDVRLGLHQGHGAFLMIDQRLLGRHHLGISLVQTGELRIVQTMNLPLLNLWASIFSSSRAPEITTSGLGTKSRLGSLFS